MIYTDKEEVVIAELMELTELTREQLLRQALRCYQLSFLKTSLESELLKLCDVSILK